LVSDKASRFGSVRRRFGADWTGLPVSMDVGSLLAAWSNAALAPLAAITSAASTVIFGGRSMGSSTILEAAGRTCAGVIRLAQSRTIAANCSNVMEHPGNGDRAPA
jgi:hypothetical protein